MIDYGPEAPDSGEVFDLTALTKEMLHRAIYSASIGLNIETRSTFNRESPQETQTEISWSGYAGEFVHGATHLEDVVNSSLPDGDRVLGLKKRVRRLRKKADDVERDAMVAKLAQVAGVRHQFPIARVNETRLLSDGLQTNERPA